MSSLASRTATMIAAAITTVEANFTLIRACSSRASRRAWFPWLKYRRRKSETATRPVEGSFPARSNEQRFTQKLFCLLGEVCPCLQPARTPVFRHPLQRDVPSRNTLPSKQLQQPKRLPAIRAKQGNQTFLRDSVPSAHKWHPHLPRFACADLRFAPPLRSAGRCSPGDGTHHLHLPPLLAWAKACL